MEIEFIKKDKNCSFIYFKMGKNEYNMIVYDIDLKEAILNDPESFQDFIPDYQYWDDYGNSEKETSVDNVLSELLLDYEVLEIYIKGLSKEELDDYKLL